ncbi:MAG: hypothetical protein K2N05_07625 [Muribaculaceae bacterium]|nr:hypothetical protein [Muribaculaceae bacterium]
MRKLILSLFVAFFFIAPVEGKKYAWEYDFKRLQKEATAGDMMSQYWLGKTYSEGRLGVTPDQAKAFEWYLKAAQQGDADSQLEVALRYEKGNGTLKNEKEFIYWLEKCADNDVDNTSTFIARINLGRFIGLGLNGLEKNPEKGIAIVKRASLRNYLSSDEVTFREVAKHNILGDLLIEKANATFNPDDYLEAEKAYGQSVNELDKRWVEGCRKDFQHALNSIALARLLYNTYADKDDYTVMIDALDRSARWGNPNAKYVLGEFYYFGEYGLEKDTSKGWKLWSECRKTHSKAAYMMAEEYYNHRNYENAVKFFTTFVESDYPEYPASDEAKSDAYRKLSTMYRYGRGVAADEKKADDYLEKAAALGDADAAQIRSWLGGM